MATFTCFNCKTHDGAYLVSFVSEDTAACPDCHGTNGQFHPVAVSTDLIEKGAIFGYDAKGKRQKPPPRK